MLESSRLVQEFSDPPETPRHAEVHRAFGGNKLGFQDAAWVYLDKMFTIESMGAGEYENGAMPQAMAFIFENSWDYIAGTLEIRASQIKGNYRRSLPGGKLLPKKQDRVVYYLCHKGVEAPIRARIIELAKNKVDVKNGCSFSHALDPLGDSSDTQRKGWLDLRNKFFVFTDKSMHIRVCETIGVST